MSLLVGDIGGTHSRFGLVAGLSLRPAAVAVEDDDDHGSFEDALAAYLEKAGERPARAAFAVAGPVGGRAAKLTNRGWTIDAAALEQRFGFDRVELVNDFAAQAASLPHLADDELDRIGAARPAEGAAKVAVGPGTGLGVAALLRDGGGWLPVASEGGHVEFAATTPLEADAFARIRESFGRVSAEQVLSGPGLSRLHAALNHAAAGGGSTAQIVAAAEAGDPAALATVRLFLAMLARFAGDVALMFGATGGVYLCGGVAPRLRRFVDEAAFRAAFEAKAPHQAIMRETATLVVSSAIAGLIGCAAIARRRV